MYIPVFWYRANRIGVWDQEKNLTLLVKDKMDLRYDLTGVHFDVTTTESSTPSVCTEAVSPMKLPPGYKAKIKACLPNC